MQLLLRLIEQPAMTGVKGTHPILAPLLETFLTEMLFAEKADLFDPRLLSRLSAQDVREYIRATFVPLIQKRTTIERKRLAQREPTKVSGWKPFQVTHSQNQPAIPAKRTLFNLVPCNRELEVAMASFLDRATDVVSFCKNAGLKHCVWITSLMRVVSHFTRRTSSRDRATVSIG